ncbi:MAG: hypothetical protein EBX67_07805 [Betaproteobacteria bacterium]|nr:hypothetical protein [Betaproteobacteria bacterium]
MGLDAVPNAGGSDLGREFTDQVGSVCIAMPRRIQNELLSSCFVVLAQLLAGELGKATAMAPG